jgi:hypothetical protein
MKTELNPAAFKRKQPEVFRIFMNYCQNEKVAKKALAWGELPQVAVAESLRGGTLCGATRGTLNPATIEIAQLRVHPVERSPKEIPNAIDRNLWYFEATLLHELIHWVRFRAGVRDPSPVPEIGDEFELEVYGELTCNTESAWNAILDQDPWIKIPD